MRKGSVTKLHFADKIDEKKARLLLSLCNGNPKSYSLDHFLALNSPDAIPTGLIHVQSDRGFDLVLNDFHEVKFATFAASTGIVSSIRGQNFILPYRKYWAKKESPYYPDFLLYTKQGYIAIIEMKSILGMCQDESIAKYEALASFCHQRGYLYAMIDRDCKTFDDYLDEEIDPAIEEAFDAIIHSQGGFNQNHLSLFLKGKSRSEAKRIRREIAKKVLSSPFIENRYCHDDPSLINAVLLEKMLPYKNF